MGGPSSRVAQDEDRLWVQGLAGDGSAVQEAVPERCGAVESRHERQECSSVPVEGPIDEAAIFDQDADPRGQRDSCNSLEKDYPQGVRVFTTIAGVAEVTLN